MIQESEPAPTTTASNNNVADDGIEREAVDGEEGGGEESVTEEDDEQENEDAWTNGENYERLLELGHILGDVKTERWRIRAGVNLIQILKFLFHF
jgi:hypothetical protein